MTYKLHTRTILIAVTALVALMISFLGWRVQAARVLFGHHATAININTTHRDAIAATFATIIIDSSGDGVPVSDGRCTLREAIINANNNDQSGSNDCDAGTAGLDNIAFNLGAGTPTISPTSALPTITEPVNINGNTGGATRVELDGTSAGANGLTITAGNSTIAGLVINRFVGHGILIQTNGGNTIKNCYLGTDANGTADLGNGATGVEIDSAANNTIGGTTASDRNLISGNGLSGVRIPMSPATGNTVIGNYIGTDVTGTVDLGNGFDGVEIGSPNNIVGGTTAGERNLISGNDRFGVYVRNSPATGNKVTGNYIGTDVTGTLALGNVSHGVLIQSASNNTVGGTTVGERNLISGNGGGVAIDQASATGNKVIGNYLGTDVNGTADLGNSANGVEINLASNNTVGGTSAGARNLISGNNLTGVYIVGAAANGNQVLGNYIGTDATGTADLGNSVGGVIIQNAPNNTVGGTSAGARNLISGKNINGVLIQGAAASGNQVLGNYIGTDANGTADLGNRQDGVYIDSAPNNTVGGTSAGARNLISGNDRFGVSIFGAAASGNQVLGNYIGTNVNGTADLGNTLEGVHIENAPNNTVGGTSAGARNLISGNDRFGVIIVGAAASGNQVLDNYIGTDATGTADLGNTASGVFILAAPNNTVGGTSAGARNLISGNDRIGVSISGATATGNVILGNSIFSNTSLGIDLAGNGVTANDALDGDTGENNLQNFPVLTCVFSANGSTTIGGTLNSLATTSFRIEFFVNDVCDASGNGEGQTFLGFQNVTTDAGGNTTINATFAQAIAAGKFITATATRLDGANAPVETSEFSACRTVSAPVLSINDVSLNEGNGGTTAFNFTVSLSAASTCNAVTVTYATANGTATAGSDYVATSGMLTFAVGETMKTVTVLVNGDTLPEPNETFFVNLSNATNATIAAARGNTALAGGQGIGTILDDDFVRASLSDPLACVAAGDVVGGTVQLTNPNAAAQAFTLTTTFTNLVGLPNTCVVTGAQAGAVCTVTTTGLTANGTAPANAVISFQFQAQIVDGLNSGTVMTTSTATIGAVTADPVVASLTVNCPAAGPGALPNAQNQLSDQKPGSVLIYPIYTSDAANGAAQNARLSFTNTNPSRTAYLHLFFVDGNSCSVADSYICLTPNQTAAFLASDIDPGTTGYVVAVATDRNGCPINFNHLIGDEYVKFASGHQANLAAESIAAVAGSLTACNLNSDAAQLNFNGTDYNALPRVLAASNLPSRADGNDTMLIVNRIGGNLGTGAATLGTLFGLLYDDAEKAYSFSLPATTCQSRGSLTNDRPRLVPRYETIIGAGRSGWLKLYGGTDIGILGAQINRNANATSNAGAFNQGHNLHKLTLTTAGSVTIPIFPPSC